jgi:hypothetical protein
MENDKDLRNIDVLSDETNQQMNKNRNKLPARIMKLHDAVAESLLLDDFNLQEKSLVSANIAHGWVTTLFAEQAVLKKLEDKETELKEAYEAKYGKPDIPRFQTMKEMNNNKQIKTMAKAVEEQAEIVRYLSEVIKIIKQNQWDIKNAINILQLEK